MEIVYAILFAVIILFIFATTFVLNSKTKAPEVDIEMTGCKGCANSFCNHNPENKTKEDM